MTGLPHTLRYGLREPMDDVVEWTVEVPFGDLERGAVLRFRSPAPSRPGTCCRWTTRRCRRASDVLARDQRGRPALVRRRHGAGAVYTSTYSIEHYGSEREHANQGDDVRRLYAALAVEAGVRPEVVADDDRVIVDGLVHEDGRRFTWFVNVSAEALTLQPVLPPGEALYELGTATATGTFDVAPFGVRVLERRIRS